MVLGESTRANSSATIVFVCSTEQMGELTKSDKTVGGFFGFEQQKMSVISQLASHGVAPRTFSHCLRVDGDCGGLLVFDRNRLAKYGLHSTCPITALLQFESGKNVQMLPINTSAFATSSNRGTIVDTGTTLTYLVEEAYDSFVNAITAAVSPNVRELIHEETQCYLISSNVNDVFPLVSLNLAGGASMILSPPNYLMLQNSFDGNALWCIGFQMRHGQGITTLRDLVLEDKIFVYDLGGSSSVNVFLVMNTGKSENVDPRRMRNGTSKEVVRYNMTLLCMILSLAISSSIIRRPSDL